MPGRPLKLRSLLAAVVTLLSLAPAVARAQHCDRPPADARPVSVATFNAWGLPWPIAPHRRARLYATESWLEEQGLDIAGLQEVWKGSRRHLRKGALLLPPLEDGDSGLALYSRHPTRDSLVRGFDTALAPDSWKHKGVLGATISLPDVGDVRVLVTHLQAGASPRAARVRRAQVETILAEAAAFEGPVLALGDFNFYDRRAEDDDSSAALAAAGLVQVGAALDDHTPSYRTGPDRFDRIWVRNGRHACLVPDSVRVGVDEPSVPSDHRPVIATLRAWAAD